MSGKIITIEVSPSGEAKIEVDGVKGGSCKDITKPFEALYSQTLSQKDKPELFQGEHTAVRLRA